LFLIVLLNIVGAFAYLCLRYRDNRKKSIGSTEVPGGEERDDSRSATPDMKFAEE